MRCNTASWIDPKRTSSTIFVGNITYKTPDLFLTEKKVINSLVIPDIQAMIFARTRQQTVLSDLPECRKWGLWSGDKWNAVFPGGRAAFSFFVGMSIRRALRSAARPAAACGGGGWKLCPMRSGALHLLHHTKSSAPHPAELTLPNLGNQQVGRHRQAIVFLSDSAAGGYCWVVNALSDPQLLRAYAESRSEAAFAELVRRHIDFVHSAAVRMVNDPHLAKDVSQAVFVALAKDAAKLTNHPVLSGWLHRTARNIAAQTVRTDVRRRNREQQAAAMNEHPETDAEWKEIAPHLDAALGDLSEPDRDAVLLRYFENKPAQEMAAVLGISAEAAQKRVSRAVDKLRENFAKRGVTAGAAGLAGVISANAVQAAPAGLTSAVSSSVFAGASSTLGKGMVMSAQRKLAIGIATAAAIVAAVDQSNRVAELRKTNEALQRGIIQQTARMIRPRATLSAAQPGDARATSKGGSEAGKQIQVMASVDGPIHHSEFSLIAPSGRGITTGAAETAGLDAAQRKAVDKILRTIWKQMENDFASRAIQNPAESDPQNEVSAFTVPARRDGGSGVIRQLETALDTEVGEAKRKTLMKGLTSRDFFGGFGALDVGLKFTKGVSKCEWIDPKSGEWKGTVESDADGFKALFGDSFEVPKPTGYPTYYR